jgi:uncharacterized protein YaaR (DUF327 family)
VWQDDQGDEEMKPIAKAKKKVRRKEEITELMSPKSQRKAERELTNHLMEIDERADGHEAYARKILDANDENVEELVEKMIDLLIGMTAPPQITYRGQVYRSVKGEDELLKRIQRKNYRYLAVRVLVACAEWGIRVSDFTLPKNYCARCGKKVK